MLRRSCSQNLGLGEFALRQGPRPRDSFVTTSEPSRRSCQTKATGTGLWGCVRGLGWSSSTSSSAAPDSRVMKSSRPGLNPFWLPTPVCAKYSAKILPSGGRGLRARRLPPGLTLLLSGNPAHALAVGGRGYDSQVLPASPQKPPEEVQEEPGPRLQWLPCPGNRYSFSGSPESLAVSLR